MVNQETGKSYFLNVDAEEGLAIAQLDAGSYSAGRFGCGIGRVWDLTGTFKDGFKIEEGSLSYLGKIIFEFDGSELDTIRIAPRAESAAAFIDAVQADADVKAWPAISGFTGKSITEGMVQVGESRDGFDVFATAKTNPVATLEPLTASLYSCAKEEGLSDPLRFGRLEYLAVYKQGRFAEMKDRKEANGFSDRLRSCVERGMMAFHPDKSSDVEVRVRY